MSSFLGGLVALVVGGGLATASVVGLVQMQSSTPSPGQPGAVESQVVDYGTNQ